jgi:hypothetical protein
MIHPKAINVDFKTMRSDRQKNNNRSVYESIQNNDIKQFHSNINENELTRLREDVELSEDELLKKCKKDELFCKVVGMLLSKNASRQGSKDETTQLKTCNLTTTKCGVNIKQLKTTEFRPTKQGIIYSGKEIKRMNIQINDCLKSFDAKIDGKFTGYISAKVSYGSGGHQDNVFEELYTLADWWSKYKSNTEDYLLILIDTDLDKKFNIIKDKYDTIDNIMIFNHYDFQNYIIDKYYDESR